MSLVIFEKYPKTQAFFPGCLLRDVSSRERGLGDQEVDSRSLAVPIHEFVAIPIYATIEPLCDASTV